MLGHQIFRHFKERHDVRVTLRLGPQAYEAYGLFERGSTFYGIDARQTDGVSQVIAEFRPDALVNAIGIIKQRAPDRACMPDNWGEIGTHEYRLCVLRSERSLLRDRCARCRRFIWKDETAG